MLKTLTRAEAHKAMDEGKVIYNQEKNVKAWRDDSHEDGPYLITYDGGVIYTMGSSWRIDWYLEVEEPWRPVEGEAVYVRDRDSKYWTYSMFSHINKVDKFPFITTNNVSWEMIAPVKGNEGSAGTTKELKNTLTVEDLK